MINFTGSQKICNKAIMKYNSSLIIINNTKDLDKVNTHIYLPGVSLFNCAEKLFDGKFLFWKKIWKKYECLIKRVI